MALWITLNAVQPVPLMLSLTQLSKNDSNKGRRVAPKVLVWTPLSMWDCLEDVLFCFKDVLKEKSRPAANDRRHSGSHIRDHILVKRPGNSTITPWHQDQPYYCVEGERTVSFWTPLDTVSRNVSLECVAGSHRWNKAGYRPKRFDGSPLYADEQFEEVPDIDAQRDQLVILGWDMAPGDAIAFDFRTIHGAPANASPVTRRVFSSRWVGPDARFVERGASGSPPFPHLTLKDGAPFDAPEFPVVYGIPSSDPANRKY